MDHMNCFKPLFKSTPGYRQIVLIMSSIENDIDFLNECCFLNKGYYASLYTV